jgi:hypothetical protein
MAEGSEVGECHGVNACRGQGDCQGIRRDGTKYTCSGKNECKSQGWVKMNENDCVKKGGTFKKSA